jgi:hypothetical protein
MRVLEPRAQRIGTRAIEIGHGAAVDHSRAAEPQGLAAVAFHDFGQARINLGLPVVSVTAFVSQTFRRQSVERPVSYKPLNERRTVGRVEIGPLQVVKLKDLVGREFAAICTNLVDTPLVIIPAFATPYGEREVGVDRLTEPVHRDLKSGYGPI